MYTASTPRGDLRSRFLPRARVAAALLGLAACGGSHSSSPDGGVDAPPDGPGGPAPGATQLTFESGPVRPLAVSSDGARLFVANTPNGSLDLLRVTPAGLVAEGSVKVGIDPVAVAVRNDGEVWVVNHVSDSVSIVDVAQVPPRVVRTLLVGDEPGDIVFAGAGRAFITTAHRGQQRSSPDLAGVPGAGDPQLTTAGVGRADVWVFDPANLGTALGGRPLAIVALFGDTPRGLAVSPDRATVYVAIFHSGNQTTGVSAALPCPGPVDSNTPCMSLMNETIPGSQLGPATNHAGIAAPKVGLIVKQDAAGAWRDARNRDWSAVTKFQLPDQDVFAIDAASLTLRQSFQHVGTTLFNLAVNPKSGAVYVSNTEARNDLRFEGPGTFAPGVTLQGHLAEARITVISGSQVLPRHLNKHIDYAIRPAPVGVKDHSLATPVDLAVSSDGATLYVAALGSAKVGVLATAELEADTFDPVAASAGYIPVSGGGPSGVVLDGHGHLLVATRFDDGVSLIDLASRAETSHVQLADPEPAKITAGRRFLYDARVSSSNGEAACASCHMFGDTDHLVWDLGNPDGDVVQTPVPIKLGVASPRTINGGDTGGAAGLHPMKGPMATQTLRGLVNHGPMHWRGDRVDGAFGRDTSAGPPYNAELAFKNFLVAFGGLLGDGAAFSSGDMQAFADFALAIVMPPNPVRRLDNALTAPQQRGRDFFMGCAGVDSLTGAAVTCQDGRPTGAGHFADGVGFDQLGFRCEGCHVLRPELGFFGTDGQMSFEALPQTVKIPQLRNLYTKVGMFGMPLIPGDNPGNNVNQGAQIRGSGFQHDGTVDTLFRFLQAQVFNSRNRVGFAGGDPQRRDVEQFLLAFDTDLAPIVGQQVTLDASNAAAAGPRIDLLIARARAPFASKVLGAAATECDLVARGVINGQAVTYTMRADGLFAPDGGGHVVSDLALRAFALVDGQQITYTCLPPGWPH